MSVLQKYTFSALFALMVAIGLYFLYQNIEQSQSLDRGIKITYLSDRGSSSGVSQANLASGKTSTGESSKTTTESGTHWGISPFGSGKPLTEAEAPKKVVFQKPNTQWKSRNVTLADGRTLNYVFGEGNPKEVALLESDMKGCSYQEGGDYCTDNGAGYVDPILEKLVYDVLNSPDWEPLLQNCEQEFRIVDKFLEPQNPPSLISYNTVVHLGQYISLEEVFIVNPQTGRKNITKEGYAKLMSLYGYIQLSSDTVNRGGLGNPLPGITTCVDTYGINIANKLVNIRWLPWRGSRDIPESQGGWNGELIPVGQDF